MTFPWVFQPPLAIELAMLPKGCYKPPRCRPSALTSGILCPHFRRDDGLGHPGPRPVCHLVVAISQEYTVSNEIAKAALEILQA